VKEKAVVFLCHLLFFSGIGGFLGAVLFKITHDFIIFA
jgi:hypothetical protein